jgi:hypothetical protein
MVFRSCDLNAGKTVREPGELSSVISSFNTCMDCGVLLQFGHGVLYNSCGECPSICGSTGMVSNRMRNP